MGVGCGGWTAGACAITCILPGGASAAVASTGAGWGFAATAAASVFVLLPPPMNSDPIPRPTKATALTPYTTIARIAVPCLAIAHRQAVPPLVSRPLLVALIR